MSHKPSQNLPSPCNRSYRLLVGVLVTAFTVSLIWTCFVSKNNLQAILAESGVQANLIRVSKILYAPPAPVVLVGSSLTGRLLPSYFSGISVSNLALEGGSSLDGMQLLLSLKVYPKSLLVEENSLTRPQNNASAFLFENATGVQMRLSRYLLTMRPEFRPSSIAYSLLKIRSDQKRKTSNNEPAAKSELANIQIPVAAEKTEANQRLFYQLAEVMSAKGTKIGVFRLPSGGASFLNIQLPSQSQTFIRKDLTTEYVNQFGDPHYTDGIHLLSQDARQFSGILEDQFRWLFPTP